MPPAPPAEPDLTAVLARVNGGDAGARDELLGRVYGELRAMAGAQVRQRGAWTLRPTALVSEAYLRLFGRRPVDWVNRRHFFSAAARAMRDVLVERARHAGALKRGADRRRVDLDDIGGEYESKDLLDLEAALSQLEGLDAVSAELVTLRFYGGLTHGQAAEVLGVSRATAERRWEFARAWLKNAIERG